MGGYLGKTGCADSCPWTTSAFTIASVTHPCNILPDATGTSEVLGLSEGMAILDRRQGGQSSHGLPGANQESSHSVSRTASTKVLSRATG